MPLGIPRGAVEVIENLRNSMPRLAWMSEETLIKIALLIFIWARTVLYSYLAYMYTVYMAGSASLSYSPHD